MAGEREDAGGGPVLDKAEEVAEVSPGFDAVELAAGEEGDEDGVDACTLVAAEKQPVLSAEDLATEVALGDVVLEREAAVVEESPQGGALVAGVAEGLRDGSAVQGDGGLLVAPLEECVEDGGRLLAADLLAFLAGCRLDRALDAEEALDAGERVTGELGLGAAIR
jgi:hypothetical protein